MKTKRSKRAKATPNREAVNGLNVLITLAFLFVALHVSDEKVVNKISRISENVDRALSKVITEQRPSYEMLETDSVYFSDTYFNHKGMAGLYNMSKFFMDLVLPQNILPHGLVDVDANGNIEIDAQVPELLKYFAGAVTIVVILLVLLVLMPFCGFCFCCCRCCGNCGSKTLPYEKNRDLCKKLLFATILICLATLLLFGVVCAFVSNEQLNEGVEDLSKNLKVAIRDSDTFMNTTKQEVDNILGTNFGRFQKALLNILSESGDIFYDELLNFTSATSLNETSEMVKKMGDVKLDLTEMKTKTNSLRAYASQLNDAVRKVKRDLLSAFQKCQDVPECRDFSDRYVNSLSTNIDFDTLPSVNDELQELNKFIDDDHLSQDINTGLQTLEDIKQNIKTSIANNLDNITRKVKESGKDVDKIKLDVSSLFVNMSRLMDEQTKPGTDKMDEYIPKYSVYVYYVGLALSCVLLLVTVFIALGLICGICGKRPAKHNNDCCNKGAGSKFLMCGVYIMFLFSAVFVIVTFAYFAIGTLSQRAICDTLQHPEESNLIDVVDKLLNLKQFNVDANVSTILQKCHKNHSIYNVLDLKKTFNLDDIQNFTQHYDIEGILDDLQNAIESQVETHVQFLDPIGIAKLEELKNSGISDIKYDKFINELSMTNFTSVSLIDLKTQLEKLIESIDRKPFRNEIAEAVSDLKLIAYHLETYQTRIVDPITENANDVIRIATDLKVSMTFGYHSFNDAIDTLLNEIEYAESTINDNGTQILVNITKTFTRNILDMVQDYIDFAMVNVQENIGKCGPLSLILNGTMTSTCDKIVKPINGYWFCAFWSVIAFIPTIIFSVKLASLYKKCDGHGLIVESDYLYDAYTDRDNIPLSGNPSKSEKKRNKRKNKRYDSRGAYTQDLNEHPREYASGSHPDNRYQDMAPKHWEEFPAGGPPQYQRAPTEYDRPPPYYYPATADQH